MNNSGKRADTPVIPLTGDAHGMRGILIYSAGISR